MVIFNLIWSAFIASLLIAVIGVVTLPVTIMLFALMGSSGVTVLWLVVTFVVYLCLERNE